MVQKLVFNHVETTWVATESAVTAGQAPARTAIRRDVGSNSDGAPFAGELGILLEDMGSSAIRACVSQKDITAGDRKRSGQEGSSEISQGGGGRRPGCKGGEGDGVDGDPVAPKGADSTRSNFRSSLRDTWDEFVDEITPMEYDVLTRDLSEHSLFLFSKKNRVRKACIYIASNKLFEWFMLVCILANCVTLALATQKPGFEDTTLGTNLRLAEYVWLGIFTVEMVIRIVALGFIRGRGSYVRDKWNLLDMIVVSVGYLDLVGGGNFTLLRAVRVLRPLRSINKIQEMKALVDTMLNSIPLLLDVVVLATFHYILFGAITINIFAGMLRGRCGTVPLSALVVNSTGLPVPVLGSDLMMQFTSTGLAGQWEVDEEQADIVCRGPVLSDLDQVSWLGAYNETTSNYQWKSYTSVPGSDGGRWCPEAEQWCVPYGNPASGYRQYDHILWAWKTMFQIMTLTDWSFTMYDCMNAVSPAVFPLFWAMVIFGSFFLLNLALAVLYLQFSKDKEQKRVAAEEAQLEQEERDLVNKMKEERRVEEEKRRMQEGELAQTAAAQGDSTLDGDRPSQLQQGAALCAPAPKNLEKHGTAGKDSKLLDGQEPAYEVPLGLDGEPVRRVYEVPPWMKEADYDDTAACDVASLDVMGASGLGQLGASGLGAYGALAAAAAVAASASGHDGLAARASGDGVAVSAVTGMASFAHTASFAAPSSRFGGSAAGSFGYLGSFGNTLSGAGSFGWIRDRSAGAMQSMRRAHLTSSHRASMAGRSAAIAVDTLAEAEEEGKERVSLHIASRRPTGTGNGDGAEGEAGAALSGKGDKEGGEGLAGGHEGSSCSSDVDIDGCCTRHVPAGKERVRRYRADHACSGLRNACYWVTEDWRLDALSMAVIGVNACVMALQWYPDMPYALDRFNDIANYGFTCYFIIEMLIKMGGMGLVKYMSSGMNVMDTVVNIACAIEMTIELIPTVDNKLANTLSVLRVFRLLRLFRLARKWKSLYAITTTLLDSVTQTFYLTMLLLLFMFVFSLLGMQLFGYTMAFCDAVDDSFATCPSGDTASCPAHFDCYVDCNWYNANRIIPVDGSPYNGMATCEVFPRAHRETLAANASAAVATAVAACLDPANNGSALLADMTDPAAGGNADLPAALAAAYLTALNRGAPEPSLDIPDPPKYVTRVDLSSVLLSSTWSINTGLLAGGNDTAAVNLTGVDLALGSELTGLGALDFGGKTYTQLSYLAQVGKPELIRSNFDNIFNGFITTFQVLTFDNWADSLHAAMRATSPWATLYYVALILIGNFMVLNLFLAILLDNFGDIDEMVEAEEEEERNQAAANADVATAEALSKAADVDKAAGARVGQAAASSAKGSVGPLWDRTRELFGCAAKVEMGKGKAKGKGVDSGGSGGMTGSAYDGVQGTSYYDGVEAASAADVVYNPVYSNLPRTPPNGGINGRSSSANGGWGTPTQVLPRGDGGGGGAHGRCVVAVGDPLAGVMALRSSFYVPLSRPAPPQHHRMLAADPESLAQAALLQQLQSQVAAAHEAALAVGPGLRQHGQAHAKPLQQSGLQRPSLPRALLQAPGQQSGDEAAPPSPATGIPLLYTLADDGRYMFSARDFLAAKEAAQRRAGAPPEVAHDAMVQMGSKLPVKAEAMRLHLEALRRCGQPEREGKGVMPPELGGGRHRGFTRPKRRTDMLLTGGTLYPLAAKPDVALGDMLVGNALCCLPPRNRVRRLMARVVTAKWFDHAMLAVICLSSIQLCLDTPSLDPDSNLKKALRVLDYIFTITFGIEAIMKVCVTGFAFNGPGSYIRSAWNVMDLLVVFAGVVVLVTDAMSRNANIMWLRAIRTLRALRPLRAANRFRGIRVVVSALLKAIPALGNVLLVAMLIYFIFSILGINIVGGRFWSCRPVEEGQAGDPLDPDYLLPKNVTMTRDWCDTNGGLDINVTTSAYHTTWGLPFEPYNLSTTWKNTATNFDNLIVAFWTLFQVATLESWSDIMYTGADITLVDHQPITNNSPTVCLYFVAFVIVGGFFLLNLVIGVSIDKFNQMRRENNGGNPHMSEEQEAWVSTQKMLTQMRALRRNVAPRNKFRAFFYHVTQNRVFEDLIMAVVVVSVGFMLLVHADMSPAFLHIVTWSNVVFTAIFVIEMVMKLIALDVRGYFSSGWNCFDGMVVAAGITGVAVDLGTDTVFTFFPVVRALRVLRLFRLIPRFKGLRTLLTTLWWSLPALINVGSVLFLLIFVYAIIGMNLFGMVREDNSSELGPYVSFRDFPISFLTLFRLMTGENWNGVMVDCMQLDQCVRIDTDYINDGWQFTKGEWYDFDDPRLNGVPQDVKTNACSPHPLVAVIYFFSYILIITFMLLQMIIGIIIDNIQNTAFQEKLPVGPSTLHTFTEVWEDLDPNGSGFIPASSLTSLLLRLPKPLGVKKLDCQMLRVQEVVLTTNIPIRNRCVQFHEVLHALAGHAAGTAVPRDQEDPLHSKLLPHIPPDFDGAPSLNAAQYYSAMYMTTAVRRLLLQDWTERKMRELQEIRDHLQARKEAGGGGMDGLDEERHEAQAEAKALAEEVRCKMQDAAATLGGELSQQKRPKRLGGVVKKFVKRKIGKNVKAIKRATGDDPTHAVREDSNSMFVKETKGDKKEREAVAKAAAKAASKAAGAHHTDLGAGRLRSDSQHSNEGSARRILADRLMDAATRVGSATGGRRLQAHTFGDKALVRASAGGAAGSDLATASSGGGGGISMSGALTARRPATDGGTGVAASHGMSASPLRPHGGSASPDHVTVEISQ